MNDHRKRVEAYTQGYEARKSCLGKNANPFVFEDSYSSEWYEWLNGWSNGEGGVSPEWYSRTIQGD